ncbi:MAG: exodeoxyribonuclease I [Gammaproteobacteria bacterium]|nr:exodeoxyribonuclease I [Gammaproteobacteria bacterium]
MANAALEHFYWYDLETSGTDAAADRIVQFAGQRTDAALASIGEPFTTYIRLTPDVLPDPGSCLVTGITPQRANREGMEEWQAFHRIRSELMQPGTCITGYNNLRFDDNFLRHGFYRNLMDPYSHEWKDGNSRFDIIDLLRAAAALRPAGMEWPRTEAGEPTFRLEILSEANGFDHSDAHDALADVQATLFLARRLREAQPKLWEYAFANRLKDSVVPLLLPLGEKVNVHVSRMYPNARHNIAPVVSVARHPHIASRLIVADLSRDISLLLESDSETLKEAIFTRSEEEPPPLKEVTLNRCPFVAPLKVVRKADAERLGFDFGQIEQRREQLTSVPGLERTIADAYRREERDSEPRDAELSLYDGFLDDGDRRAMDRVQNALQDGLPWPPFSPDDGRVRTLATRLKARVRPGELDAVERAQWHEHVAACQHEGLGRRPSLAEYRKRIKELRVETTAPEDLALLDELQRYQPESH